MAPEKKMIQNDEIDLVELLGVVIKRRKFIIWFIAILTVLAAMLLCFREYRNSKTVETTYKIENAVETDNDLIFNTYMVLKKGADQGNYPNFLKLLLYPSTVGTPSFELVHKGASRMTYLMQSQQDSVEFVKRYNAFVSLLVQLDGYKNRLSEESFSNCRQFGAFRTYLSAKDLSIYFRNVDEMRACNMFNYYYGILQGKISYALENVTMPETYVSIMSDMMPQDTKQAMLAPADRTEEGENEIKITVKSSFDKKKVGKYSILVMVLSGILAVFFVFVMEFLSNNRSKLGRYWK